MSFSIGHISGIRKGGTRRPLVIRNWTHLCERDPLGGGRTLSTYSCPDCGARRPS